MIYIFFTTIVITLYLVFFGLTEGYLSGRTIQDFFTNKIENAGKLKELTQIDDIQYKLEGMRYRSKGGVWKLLFSIFQLPGVLVGIIISLLTIPVGYIIRIFFTYVVLTPLFIIYLFFRLIRVKSVADYIGEKYDSFWIKLDEFYGKYFYTSVSYGLRFLFTLFAYYFISGISFAILADYDYGSIFRMILEGASFERIVDGFIVPKLVTLVKMLLFVGMLCPQMEEIEWISNLSDKLNQHGERVYRNYANYSIEVKAVVMSFFAGLYQCIVATVADFISQAKMWKTFKKKKGAIAAVAVLIFGYIVLNEIKGNTIYLDDYFESMLALVQNVVDFVKIWLFLFFIRFFFCFVPGVICKNVVPNFFVGISGVLNEVSSSASSAEEELEKMTKEVAVKVVESAINSCENLYNKACDKMYERARRSEEENQDRNTNNDNDKRDLTGEVEETLRSLNAIENSAK